MGFWDIFKKKKKAAESSSLNNAKSKDELYMKLFEQMAQKSPSEHFATGAVFDITRQQRDVFEKLVRSNDPLGLLKFFLNAYVSFCNNPGIVGFAPSMVNANNNDTDLNSWNADTFTFPNGDAAALCYIPIQNETLDARMIGIILSDSGDGYYYCMLDKDKEAASAVKRNKAMFGVSQVGEVKGRGFELMENFLNCIKEDFYSSDAPEFF